MPANLALKKEREAFDSQLSTLLRRYTGKYALFKGGKPIGFFDDHTSAYEAGLEKFGLDTSFLVAHAIKPDPQSVSIAWDAGVMVG